MGDLEARCDQLEEQLARQVPAREVERRLRAVSREAVAQALPSNTALVEFVRFRPFRFEARGREQPWGPARYAAFVLRAGDPHRVQMIDLGEAEEMDRWIGRFRGTIMEGGDGALPPALRDACRGLYDRVFAPLQKAAGGAEHLFLAPDGELLRLPFEALLSPEGRFVIEDHSLSYVGTARDVLRFGQVLGEPTEALIIADPDYDLCAEGSAEAETPPSESRGSSVQAIRGMLRRDIWDPLREWLEDIWQDVKQTFDRLPGTRTEGERIYELLRRRGIPVRRPWFDRQALERPLKRVRAPRILHIATHGFFWRDMGERLWEWLMGSSLTRGLGISGIRGERGGFLPLVTNPLLRSGLALAGYNASIRNKPPAPEAEDGTLTALDVSVLDLLGTELVVLSACETALGDVRCGEGVFGLRRAFIQAGARTLVMSLWKVADEETLFLMERLYENLLQEGLPKPEALRRAQLDLMDRLRREKGFAHPYFWAAFICQGDPAPLGR